MSFLRGYSKHRNLTVMIAVDALLITACFYAAMLIRFEFRIPAIELDLFQRVWPLLLCVKMGVFILFNLYRGMWRYTSLQDLINVLKAVFSSSLILMAVMLMVNRFQGYSRSVFIMDGVLTLIAIGGFRVLIRLYFARGSGLGLLPGFGRLRRRGARKLMLIGAGDEGERVLREILDNPGMMMDPVGLLDDDPRKQGRMLHGVPVLGRVEDIADLTDQFDEILVTAPSASGEQMRRIMNVCERTGKPLRTVPGIGELIDGRISVKTVRNVTLEDLMDREELHLDTDEIARYLSGRRVMVTGAGGSIGSELVRQIGRFAPQALALVEVNEFHLWRVDAECRQRFGSLPIHPYLVDIRNPETLGRVFREFRPEVLFHAAAYKHVPMQEHFPWEAVVNNIIGTRNLVRISLEAGVDKFVLVSTDKAVRPTNIMGATKRVAELLIECANHSAQTRFMAVRFGNVMGSSGSTIPIFQEQIARGGPVTVTHPEVTRYFMSVGEAAQLILQAGALGHGGEIFILDMGRPVRIVDLARDLIRLHGLEPDRDISIRYIGLRPGEKLHEELITSGEGIVESGHDKILMLRGRTCDLIDLNRQIDELAEAARTLDREIIRRKLQELVPEYTPENTD